jgi:hypothetical protein
VVEPVFELVRPKVIVEIGSDQGYNTKCLLDFCRRADATLHVVDPAPGYDASEWRREHGERFVFHEDLSLNALPRIEAFDAVLIDGDHNWYTVFNELKLIERLCEERSQDFPLVLLHDIGWPYGRRDLYYDPDTIPQEYRKPHEKKGMMPGVPGLVEEGGMNRHLWNAVQEGEPREGVLTAVEDFLGETSKRLELITAPGINGLGILVPSRLKEQNAEFGRILENLNFSPFVERYIGGVEWARQFLEIRRQGQVRELNEQIREARRILKDERRKVREVNEGLRKTQKELAKTQKELAKTQKELAKTRQKARHDVAKLTRWMEEMEDGVSTLLNSWQWKAGRAFGELYRKASRKPAESAVGVHLEDILRRFQAWREDHERSPDDVATEDEHKPEA